MTSSPPFSTVLLPDSETGITAAVEFLRSGSQVAFPTETVYGLGADARNGAAVAAIYAAKGRPSFNPLIVHVADLQAATHYADLDATAQKLGHAFWPGPLTLVLPLRRDHGLSSLVTAGLPSVALRVPAHPLAQRLLKAFDGPIAAPSANPSGKISPTRAAHVQAGLSGRIAAVIDGGTCRVGLESTIVSPTPPTILRPGGLAAEEISALLNQPLQAPDVSGITAPGQLASHYSPNAKVRLNVTSPRDDEFMIGFGDVPGDISLSPSGDLIEAASHLFDHLHTANAAERPIAIAPIPEAGLGRAINDRLRRAAAPRG